MIFLDERGHAVYQRLDYVQAYIHRQIVFNEREHAHCHEVGESFAPLHHMQCGRDVSLDLVQCIVQRTLHGEWTVAQLVKWVRLERQETERGLAACLPGEYYFANLAYYAGRLAVMYELEYMIAAIATL